jgi:hypothetical protein
VVKRGVNKLKNGKAAGEDVITNEMMKCARPEVVEWLSSVFNM